MQYTLPEDERLMRQREEYSDAIEYFDLMVSKQPDGTWKMADKDGYITEHEDLDDVEEELQRVEKVYVRKEGDKS